MSWNIGENRNIFFILKSNLGLYDNVLTTPESPPEKVTLTLVEMQQLPEFEKVESKK